MLMKASRWASIELALLKERKKERKKEKSRFLTVSGWTVRYVASRYTLHSSYNFSYIYNCVYTANRFWNVSTCTSPSTSLESDDDKLHVPDTLTTNLYVATPGEVTMGLCLSLYYHYTNLIFVREWHESGRSREGHLTRAKKFSFSSSLDLDVTCSSSLT